MGNKLRFYADLQSLQSDVTGSHNLVTVSYPDGRKEPFLVDFGLYQGSREQEEWNEKIGFKPEKLVAIFLTHAHIDHCGRIPMLYKHGATCRTLMSNDTMKVAEKLLKNTESIISNDQLKAPIYNNTDLEHALKEFRACEYGEFIQVTENIKVMFIQNQHIPGATSVYVVISYEGEEDITLLFTGDYNLVNAFSSKQTTIPSFILEKPLSLMVLESTYGSRKSKDVEKGLFKREIEELVNERKTIVIPAFAYGRYQNVLWKLKQLEEEGSLADVPIFMDGGLGLDLTYLWQYLDTVEIKDFIPKRAVAAEDRKQVMFLNIPKIIVTTSGMGNFGPAREYIPRYISEKWAAIYLTGYSSPDSNSRKILEAQEGEIIKVSGVVKEKHAIVKCTCEFSSHARKEALISFVKQFKKINFIVLNHGEEESKNSLSQACYELDNVKDVGIMDGMTDFRINCYGLSKTFRI